MNNNENFSKQNINKQNDTVEKIFETRKKIIDSLKHNLESNPKVIAFCLEGANVENSVDEYSDIDMRVVVEEDGIKEADKLIKSCVEKFSPIQTEYIKDLPNDIHQVLYQFRDISKFMIVDVMIQPYSDDFDISDRKFNVLFDKKM